MAEPPGSGCPGDPGSVGLGQPLAHTARTVPAGVTRAHLLSRDGCFTAGQFWPLVASSENSPFSAERRRQQRTAQ